MSGPTLPTWAENVSPETPPQGGDIKHYVPVGFFDYYQPVPSIPCEFCGSDILYWQGKGGPNFMVLWRQGERFPVAHMVDEDNRWDLQRLREFELPQVFYIYGDCGNPGHSNGAVCECEDGVWAQTSTDHETLARHFYT